MWKVDTRGKLHPTPLYQHRLDVGITHCVMLHSNTKSKTLADIGRETRQSVLDAYTWKNKSAPVVADPISCFCATSEGTHLTTVQGSRGQTQGTNKQCLLVKYKVTLLLWECYFWRRF